MSAFVRTPSARRALAIVLPAIGWLALALVAAACAPALGATTDPRGTAVLGEAAAASTATVTPAATATMTPTATSVVTTTATPAPPTTTPTTVPTPTAPPATPTPTVRLSEIKPNELGVIPILAYHLIDEPESRWSRSPAHFRQDLERLYRARFRLIPLPDFVDNKIDVPAGYSPLVLTFDDSSPGQFRFIKNGDRLEVDPNSAVGILQQFYREHPDFGRAAMFFVLPAAEKPHNLFGQDEYQKEKLRYLVENGMQFGNHSFWHQRLDIVDDEEVQHQLGRARKVLNDLVPGYTLDILSLPLGQWPKNRALARAGKWQDVEYRHRAIMLAGTDGTPSPAHVDYDPFAIQRIQAVGEVLDFWLRRFETEPGFRYVSDGDPDRVTFPASQAAKLKPGLGRPVETGDDNYRAVAVR